MKNGRKVKWGILSTARIGLDKVIPAMQQCGNVEVVAIASRQPQMAADAASRLGIPKHYGSYEALLHDPEVEAIYNPLPNHMHFTYTKMAIEHGKHVLCEKPMTLSKEEINTLMHLRDLHKVKVGEAFMVHTHPQWRKVVELVKNGHIGNLLAVQGFFSYFKTDPTNIRNIMAFGGGAMWDIGCYPIHTTRMVFGEEPRRAVALIDRDPVLKTDRLASVILDFPSGQCSFMVSTQLVAHQRMIFFGDEKRIEIEIPFNAPTDRPCRIFVQDGNLLAPGREEIHFDTCDQYNIQGEAFSDAIIHDGPVPVSLENAYGNTSTIEAIFESEKTGQWVSVAKG
ncbi:MAG: Gfo/Idh/MocA family oxidoreductase [Cyclobacteriaceae bacterium]|nr:Gfo/Idh/MocA family oxidoreductase [Cyclobacteriaceae bacterium]